jgi:hypothetical protein
VRTDKLSIIADAVKEVTKLRAESHQLRQLNKFLEVVPSGTTMCHAKACKSLSHLLMCASVMNESWSSGNDGCLWLRCTWPVSIVRSG